MQSNHRRVFRKFAGILFLLIFVLVFFLPGHVGARGNSNQTQSGAAGTPGSQVFLPLAMKPRVQLDIPTTRLVNAPYFDGDIPYPETALFWFGKVSLSSNYSDVRVGYNQNKLYINIAIFDRLLWYQENPNPADIPNWDSVSLYISPDGITGGSPGANDFRFDGEVNQWQPRPQYQAGYRGNGSGWASSNIPFTTATGWRGEGGFNGTADDRGWVITYEIKFSDLGLSAPPPEGTIWGLGVVVHDRDSQSNPVVNSNWPETMINSKPSSWGQLRFGIPIYNSPTSSPAGSVIIRDRLDGASVEDADVGGRTMCGEGTNFWTEWGNTTHPGNDNDATINVQNQSDVADWPCFSKFYMIFPLDSLPGGKIIKHAQITIYQTGNSGGGQWGTPGSSYVQVMTEAENWSENTLTWNNAPLALENVSGAWVGSLASFPGWPGVARTWDISRAVAQAYTNGNPLRLVFYEADSQYHSGKYFVSSEAGDWDANGRPTLKVDLGNP